MSSFSLAIAAPSMLPEARARAKLTGAPGPTPAPGSPAKAALLCVEPPQRLGRERPGAPPAKQSLDLCWLSEGHSPPRWEFQGAGGSPHPPRPSLRRASRSPRGHLRAVDQGIEGRVLSAIHVLDAVQKGRGIN